MLITRLVAYNERRHDSYPQFPRCPLGMPGTMTTICRGNEKKKKERNIDIFKVSQLKQARLIKICM